jgi:hypothetical protein
MDEEVAIAREADNHIFPATADGDDHLPAEGARNLIGWVRSREPRIEDPDPLEASAGQSRV